MPFVSVLILINPEIGETFRTEGREEGGFKIGERGRDYYLNEIKAGRFSVIEYRGPVSDKAREILNLPKPTGDWGLIKFTVWTSRKREAKKIADSIFYGILGCIPGHYYTYVGTYRNDAKKDLELGFHNDGKLKEFVRELPEDAPHCDD